MVPSIPRPYVRLRALGAGSFIAVVLGIIVGCERQAPEDEARASAPIVGGEPDNLNKGVVSLLREVRGGFYPSCSATLLTQNLVLTAHHCVAALSSGDAASVECGKTEFRESEPASAMRVSVEQNVWEQSLPLYRVAQVWVPEGGSEVCGRDIALLMLSGSGVPASVATPIAPRLDEDLRAQEAFTAIGYGLQDPKDNTGKTAGQRMVSTDAEVFCGGSACGSPLVKETEFIAQSPVCSGDSGGPALDASGLVSGVTSRGDVDCTIGIYSSVAAWKDFIVEKAFVAAQSGGYVPPVWAGAPPPSYVPAVDPLGTSCTSACALGYQCWSASGKPPGICVPPCGNGLAECPSGYTCDAGLSVCTAAPETREEEQGCALSAPRKDRDGALLAAGLLAIGAAVRRRRSNATSTRPPAQSPSARGRARSK